MANKKMTAPNPIPRSLTGFIAEICRERKIKLWYAVLVVCVFAQVAAGLTLSFVIGRVVYVIQNTQNPSWQDFVILVGAAFALRLLVVFFNWLWEIGWLKARLPMEMNGYAFLLRNTIEHSHGYFSDNPAGKVAQKVGDIPWASMQLMVSIIDNIMPSIATLSITMIFLAALNFSLGIVMLLWFIPSIITMIIVAKQRAKLCFSRARSRGETIGAIVDTITNNISVRTFASSAYEMKHVGKFINEHRINTGNLLRHNQIFAAARDLSAAILVFLVMGWGVYLYVGGFIGADKLVVVITLSTLAATSIERLLKGLSDFLEESGTIREGLSLLSGTYEVTDAKDAQAITVNDGTISFNNISFTYKYAHDAAIKNYNLTIPAGQRVGLIGHSGAGKSTILNLLCRFYDVQQGDISIDGHDIRQFTQHSLRRQIAFIPQDTMLFHRTLRENIRYGNPTASDSEVEKAAELAYCSQFITALPQGYDTMVGERGIKLSGGQRQRIAIARAILKKAPIILLDEATSALDSESEQFIQKSLALVMEKRTVLAIAHRLSTIRHLDRLIVMDKGIIVEDGTHEELVARGGLYARLWSMQSEGFIGKDTLNT